MKISVVQEVDGLEKNEMDRLSGNYASKSDERTQIMLDTTPLCCNLWDEDYNNIDCNQEAASLFGLKSKQEYLNRFDELSPKYQPNGELSAKLAKDRVTKAFKEGYCKFEWMHQKPGGVEMIPAEITLVRVPLRGQVMVAGYTRDLRELKESLAKIREVDERNQLMLDATPLCCNFWDKDFNNIDCNQEATNLFGLSCKQEYLDRFDELSPKYQPNGRLSTEMAHENVERAFKEGRISFEWMHQKPGGVEMIPAEITLVRMDFRGEPVVVGYTRDLRELKATLAEMRKADERTQIMLDATPLCCNFWDKDFNNIDCNQEAANLFGLSGKQEYLDRFNELSPQYQPNGRLSEEMALENVTKAFKDGYHKFEWVHQLPGGVEMIPAEITLVRVMSKGEPVVAGYTRDLRELKETMAQIEATQKDLRLARDQAEESARAKSEFLANMSHEIRTPMNAILGMTHLVLQTEVTEKQRNYLEKTEQSAKSLLRIINDILDFSKIEAGKLEIERVNFSLKQVLEYVRDVVAEDLEEKKLELQIEVDEQIPDVLCGDSLRLYQVVLNLVNNAVKFTTQGNIKIEVKQIQTFKNCLKLFFAVTDTGIGMAEEQVEELFTPFMQGDSSTTRKFGGTGLGLAICKSLVNLMDGTITCKSSLGNGSRFEFSAVFTLSEQARDAHNGKPAKKAESTSFNTKEKRILLAEDNEINRMLAIELLTMKGYQVEAVSNGRMAVEKVREGNYDLVLMDIQMPEMDGLAATMEIRKDSRFFDLPILAMTAHAMAGDREVSLKVGMNDHVTKPVVPDVLYATIEKWLR